jgi:hypothetical protein
MTKKQLIIPCISYFLILFIILISYWFVYDDIYLGDKTPDIIASVVQNSIIAGLTAVSIILPLTVGILGYAVKNEIDCTKVLFCACASFLISTCSALWNLFRLPGLVTTLNIANDYKTAVFQIIQFWSLLFGFACLLIGAWRIVKR